MPPPKLSSRSRLAASPAASLMLLMLYFVFLLHNSAYAADIDSIRREDHNHDRLLERDEHRADIECSEPRGDDAHRTSFLDSIIGRSSTSDSSIQLENNIAKLDNIAQGATNLYKFPDTKQSSRVRDTNGEDADTLEETIEETDTVDIEPRVQKRATSQLVYITVNVCSQPKRQNTTGDPPPQLQLYISQDESNSSPGPDSDGDQDSFDLVEGATMQTVNATGTIYIGLYGQNSSGYEDMWSAEIAASTDDFYHNYVDQAEPNLRLIDSDSGAALLISGNLTNESSSSPTYQKVLNDAPPYVLFVSNSSNQATKGLQNSYCGLMQNADVKPLDTGENPGDIQTSLTTRGHNPPRQQFYLSGISKGTTYNATLAMPAGKSSSTIARRAGVVGGGGQIWPSMNFTTLSDGNCAVIYDLSFCDKTAYTVPANPKNFKTMNSLASFYDNATSEYYRSFQKALAQVPCNTTSSAQYSIARTCDDCASAYKDWLCAVNIPRCTDFSSNYSWLQSRSMVYPSLDGEMLPPETVNFANQSLALSSSRNPQIDQYVMPGPYKEILPCDSLCYNIVQSCPSSLQFGCPTPGQRGFNTSYGTKSDRHHLTCNFLGAEFPAGPISGAETAKPQLWIILALLVVILQMV